MLSFWQHKKVNFALLTIICAMVLSISDVSFAQYFQPESSVSIQTQLSSGSGKTQDLQWSVLPAENSDGITTLSFFMKGADQPLCQLGVSEIDNRVEWLAGNPGPGIISSDDLIVDPGYPAPCAILPVAKVLSGNGKTITYAIKRKAGGSTVMEKFQVDSVPVGMDEAIKNGWIRNNLNAGDNLYMIRVRNLRTNVLVAQQLWSKNGDWWIYEKTPFRCSWRMR